MAGNHAGNHSPRIRGIRNNNTGWERPGSGLAGRGRGRDQLVGIDANSVVYGDAACIIAIILTISGKKTHSGEKKQKKNTYEHKIWFFQKQIS